MAAKSFWLLFLFLCVAVSPVLAYTVVVREETQGMYKKGIFTPGPGLYQYTFNVDEHARTVTMTQMRRLQDNAVVGSARNYDILYITNKTVNKRVQRFIVFSEAAEDRWVETFILGSKTFEHCKAFSDHYLLSSGVVDLSVSLRENA